LAAVLGHHLASVLAADEFDVVPGDAPGEVEAMTDDWTLHIERWPDGPAFLALDDEPDDPAALGEAIIEVMSAPVVAALAAVDRDVAGALSTALRASADPLSLVLARIMGEDQGTLD
jgi:hypothetical protein